MIESSRASLPILGNTSSKSDWQRYIALGVAANLSIWIVAILCLKVMPSSYRSQMLINLPGSSSTTQVDVPGVGGASVQNTSPYASAQDPRENYRLIISSEVVLESAARRLKYPIEQLGKPRIKLIDGTSIMEIEFPGSTPTEAQAKAVSLYKALEARLEQLRQQEVGEQELKVRSTVALAREKLEDAERQLSAYQAKSGLGSEEQIQELSKNIEALRLRRSELITEFSKNDARLNQLTADLKLPAEQASDALLLQSDSLFQQTIQAYSEVSNNLVTLETTFTEQNPKLIAAREKQRAFQTALIERGTEVLNHPVTPDYLNALALNNSTSPSARESLLRELVITQADQKGSEFQARESDRQLTQLEERLQQLVQLSSNLESRKRDVQIAEAVFSSKLTQGDLDRSNFYASYPRIQMLAEPNLPKNPSSTQKLLILGGALLGSILVSSGLIMHWLQQQRLQKKMRFEERGKDESRLKLEETRRGNSTVD